MGAAPYVTGDRPERAPAAGVGVPTDVAYVTACALGLAYSRHGVDAAVVDLLGAAEGRPETLTAARAVLPAYPAQDPAVVRAADDLLAAAERAARVSAPPG